eukprot:s6369_g3.t1
MQPFTAPLIPLPSAMLGSAPSLSRSFFKLWTPASARAAAQLQRPPLPPFSREDAIKKVRMAENAWNTRDPETVSLAYTEDCVWRNRDTFFQGREAIVKFLRQKWEKEQEYRLIKELFAFEGNRIGVCFQYEFKDASTGIWYRAYGNENWDFAADGLMCRRQASINDVQIKESDRRFTWPELGKRPEDFPSLSHSIWHYRMDTARGEARRSFIASWVVEHRAVLIRSQPSVKAEKLGIVCKGHVLKGYEMEGWVKLTRESSIQAGVADGRVAWVLIDGQEVGLGLLLRPLKPGEKPRTEKDAREESDDEKYGVAWRSEDIYTGALEFEVLFKSVSVRRRPRVTSKSLGIVTEGNRVWGYAKDNWLQTNRKYRQKEQGWIRIDGTDLGHGQLLQCTMMKPATMKCFAEALLINWQPLPAKSVVYTLEWMAQDKKKISVAVDKTRHCVGKIGALAADSTFYVRVTAHILIPGVDANSPKSVCAKVSSDWVEAQTGSAVDETEEAAMTFDPLAKIRGKCGDCQHCANFILSKYSYLMRLDEVLCRRCGCACTSHEIVGEYGKSRAQWAKDNERRQREGQRRQQQVTKPKPIMPAELPCVPWQPDDAPVGKNKARYVIEQVKKARNLYETLGVRPAAAAKDIRNAYRQIALRIHPDKVTSGGKEEEDLVAQAEAAFKLVSSAYEVLGDEGKRSSYNHTAKAGGKAAAASPKPSGPRTTAPASQREHWPGGSGTSKGEVVLTVSHAVHGEEIRMSMNRGTSVMGLKRALCKKVKRGPPECIDICDSSGCILGDDHRFAENQELHCIGISLGPPKTIAVEVKDHRSGARMQVEVLDTSSMETVRKKVARELKVKEKELQIGQQKSAGKYSARRFEALPSEELLNGRRMLYIHGNGVLIYLSLEQGLQLQRELIVAYGEAIFQKKLESLLSEYPMPESITQMKFREAFGKLVRDAQKATLARWGFEGDFAAQNMMTAFGKVAHTPEVYELSLEIDKLLRITSGGMIAAPVKPKKEAQAKATASASDAKEKSEKPKNSKVPSKSGPKPPVVITVRQAVEEDNEPPAPPLKVAVPADATMRRLKQAIAEKLGLKRTASLKLVFHLDSRLRKSNMPESGMTFASFKDDELIGSRREVLLLGADLRDVAEVRVELSGVPQLPDGTVVVFVSQSATLREVKEAAARKLLGKEAEEPTAARIAEQWPWQCASLGRTSRSRLNLPLQGSACLTSLHTRLMSRRTHGEALVVSHLDYIVSELQRSPSSEMKQAICKAVIAAGPAATAFYHEIATLISDNNPEVRYWGCLAVGTMGSSASGAKRQIRSLLQDSSEAVRFGACSALGGMKAEDCMEDLKEKLADPSPEVQGAACLALGRMGVAGTKYAEMIVPKPGTHPRSKYCEKVVECLCDEDAETRALAASVVGKMSEYVKDTPAAMNRILDLAKDEDLRTARTFLQGPQEVER